MDIHAGAAELGSAATAESRAPLEPGHRTPPARGDHGFMHNLTITPRPKLKKNEVSRTLEIAANMEPKEKKKV